MERLFEKIYQKFEDNKKIFIDNGLKPIKYIDLYRGQPLAPERFEFFALPAIFLEYTIDKKSKSFTLNAHVVTEMREETSNVATKRLKGLEILKYYRLVNAVLKGVESQFTGKLIPVSERPAETDVVNYQVLVFEGSIAEEKMIVTSTSVTPDFTLEKKRGKTYGLD